MKLKEFIEKLSKENPELDVFVNIYSPEDSCDMGEDIPSEHIFYKIKNNQIIIDGHF